MDYDDEVQNIGQSITKMLKHRNNVMDSMSQQEIERKSLKTLFAIPLSYSEPGHDAVQPYHQHPNVHRTKIRGDLLRYYVLPCPGHSSLQ